MELISRQAVKEMIKNHRSDFSTEKDYRTARACANAVPPAVRHDKNKVSDLLYCIYSIQSPHLDVTGVVAKKYYCEELWKELFGKESELPGWMS